MQLDKTADGHEIQDQIKVKHAMVWASKVRMIDLRVGPTDSPIT